ncbi:hypothetical protein [Brevibacillus reuszeri]|uniref:hypothetical protein n=1 Tax=Brevibacillus reuszeri TaxID=54915 RepID=UPI000CCC6CA9|nr:hypothetical protein [Brevibacillus reuszeri]
MDKLKRIGWLIQLKCKCDPEITHIITEAEIRDVDGEISATVFCHGCRRPLLIIEDDGRVYAVGDRLL